MKSKYFIAAGLVVLIGIVSIWIILIQLPKMVGSEVNPTTKIDKLENEGWIDFKSITLDGQEFEMSELEGRVVLFSFWASWCAPCLEEFPSQIKLAEKFGDKFAFVALSEDSSAEEAKTFLMNFPEHKQSNIYVIWDEGGKIAKQYGIGKLPENFIFAKNKKLSRKVVGAINWHSEDAVSFFQNLISAP